MIAVTSDIVFNVWILNNVGAQERWQAGHTQEFIGFVEMHVQTVNPLTVEELVRIVKCFLWCVPWVRDNICCLP